MFQVVWGFEGFGGLEHHLAELALALAERGAEVHVFAEAPVSPDNAYVQRLRRGGIPTSGANRVSTVAHHLGRMRLGPVWRVAVRSLQAFRWLHAHTPGTRRAASPGDELILARRGFHPVTADLFRRLDAAAAKAPPDVVHVHGTRLRQSWVISWAAARGIATAYTEHITLDEWGGPGDPESVQVVTSELGALACVSERSRTSLRGALGDSFPVAVVRHIVSAVDGASRPPDHGPLRLLTVARLELIKGIDVLLHALATARERGTEVHLTIAGDGTQRDALVALVRTLALRNVEFLGAVSPHAVGHLMQKAHAVVLPSRGEGLPVVLIEAMANGRAVIAARSGGIGEVVTDGCTGLLVNPEQPGQLADAIVRMAADLPALVRMGAAGRRAWEAGGWTPDAVLAETDALYRAARVQADARAVHA